MAGTGLGLVAVARDARDAAALLRGRRGTFDIDVRLFGRRGTSDTWLSVLPGWRGTSDTWLGLMTRLGRL